MTVLNATRIKQRILATVKLTSLSQVKEAWKEVGIDFYLGEKDGVIELSKIVLPKQERGKGTGSKAMMMLTDYADESGQTIILTPSSDFGGSKGRLVSFYKSFGFVDNKGRNKNYEFRETMYRRPAN